MICSLGLGFRVAFNAMRIRTNNGRRCGCKGDFCHGGGFAAGLLYAGAAVYIVVDSSSLVWTAVWSRLILKKKYTNLQWLAVGFSPTLGS